MYVFAGNRKWQTIGKGKVSVHDGVTSFSFIDLPFPPLLCRVSAVPVHY